MRITLAKILSDFLLFIMTKFYYRFSINYIICLIKKLILQFQDILIFGYYGLIEK